MNKLIETALPLSEINARTIRERTVAGHPANMHMWWGRSPQVSSVLSLTAAMVDAPEDPAELQERLQRVLDGGYTEFGKKPTVFDPFSGFGGIPLAAQMLGIPAIAADLNPVAVMLTKAATEIPAKFAGHAAVNPHSLQQPYPGSQGLAEDVLYYGEWLGKQVQQKLETLYPGEPEGTVAAWIWARTITCPNPACGCRMPMVSSFVINGKAGQECWAEPIVEHGKVHFELRSGPCPKEKQSNKYRTGAKFVCPACGAMTTDDYVKSHGLAHKLGAQLMAMVVDTPNGRIYKAPTKEQENAANVPMPEDVPQGEIPGNAHWFSPPGFGIKEYSELFSPRQMTMLTTFCDLLLDVQDKAASDALAAGMSPEGGSLADGGRGALAYGQAVSIYLAFAIDKLADRNSTVCTWNSSGSIPRATFTRQAIPMAWNYAEGNPFSSITGNYDTAMKNIVACIEQLPCGSSVQVFHGDAVTEDYPQNVVICTELPYYKAIGYAQLSDFFYIWMRRSLKCVFPELFNPMVTSKEELSTTEQYYGKSQADCEKKYAEKLQIILNKFYQCSNPQYPTLLFFEFHKADAQAIQKPDSAVQKNTAWETMLERLTQAGFSVNAVWPMRSTPFSDNADGTRILIVARKAEKAVQTTRRGFINTLKRELPSKLNVLLSAGVEDHDREIVCMGCGLSIFTRYQRVMNADGTVTNIRDALQLIYQETERYIHCHTDDQSTDHAVTEED